MNKFRRAFSLIEVSAVILIIGIVIAGLFTGGLIVSKSRLAAAESLAKSSPIRSIKENILWLETSLSGSISDTEANSGTAVTSWNDQSISTNKPSVVAVGTGATYSNTINSVHAIKFTGSSSNYLQISDASFLNNTDYTIMVLEKRQSNSGNNFFIGESPNGTANQNLALGYDSDSSVIHSQGSDSYNAGVSTYSESADRPRLFMFTHSAKNGNATYINGVLAAQDDTKTTHLKNISTLAIGKGYTGEIGEIAIFTKALNTSERQVIEDYGGKKWTRSINRNKVANASCVGYTVTDSGCDLSTPACSGSCSSGAGCTLGLTGSTDSSSVANGATGTVTCNSSGYSGSTVSYTCTNGTVSYGGSCSCNTGGGYVASGGSCVLGASCSTSSVTGVTTPTTVAHQASGTLTCNTANHYTGTVTYSCNNGALNPSGSCACAVGYVNPNCASCDTANGYSMSGGQCLSSPCTGGTIDTTSVPGSVIHKFIGNGSFVCSTAKTVQVLIVGGGGGGGAFNGGGGAGGLIANSGISINAGTYPVVVGNGGNGETGPNSGGTNGGNSSFNGLIAIGGGHGAHSSNATSGGSGGGGGYSSTARAGATAGQGNIGGLGAMPGNWATVGASGGGGGGSGSAGGDAGVGIAGAAGAGTQSSITGTPTYYAVGGPGAGYNSSGALVTTGTPAAGGSTITQAGAANTGNGGGAGNTMWLGKNGGSGVVIIKY